MDRRRFLLAGSAIAAAGDFLAAHARETAAALIDRADLGPRSLRMHDGRGLIEVKFFFEPERPARPALFLQYDIPPSASEGVHTHGAGRPEGAWDEYYYIATGEGQMTLEGRTVPVRASDTIHTPLGVAHGIENTSRDQHLRACRWAIALS